jgi:archaellum component FlaC
LIDSVKRLEGQLEKSKEKLEAVQREQLSNIKTYEQTETVLRAEIGLLNERMESSQTTIRNSNRELERLKKIIEE